MISLTIHGAETPIRRIAAIIRLRPFRRALRESADVLMRAARDYPPYRYVKQPIDYSERQRRYVMAMIRAGVITPGRSNRSGRLGRNWRARVGLFSAEIENPTPYAGYVQGAGTQTASHGQRGWDTTDGIKRRAQPDVIEAWRSAYSDALNGRLI